MFLCLVQPMELGRWLWNLTAVIGGLVDVRMHDTTKSVTCAMPRDNEVEKCEQIRPQFSNLKIESDAEAPPTWVNYSAEHELEQKQLSGVVAWLAFCVVYWHHGISLGDLLLPPDPHQFLDYTAITFFRNQAFDANRQMDILNELMPGELGFIFSYIPDVRPVIYSGYHLWFQFWLLSLAFLVVKR